MQLLWPVNELYVPGKHGVVDTAPSTGVNDPAEANIHAVAPPVEYLPATQYRKIVEPAFLPALEYAPAGVHIHTEFPLDVA